MDAAVARRLLLAWYDQHARDLPWRAPQGEADPYRVWLSEVMLQQTRVETVRPRFEAWLEHFPDVEALAAASEEDVMAAWAGLGYYRRARSLHAAARQIVADGWPSDRGGWQSLPGIGDYTAGAIASIADGRSVPAVDGNVLRVLARRAGIEDPIDSPAGRKRVEALAARLVDPARPGDWNQALMDLGATICTPRTPRCGDCPWEGHCRARAAGTQDSLPVRSARRPPVAQTHHFAYVEQDGKVLVVERPEGLLAGTWFLPGGGARETLAATVRAQTGAAAEVGPARGRAQHTFTHRRWTMEVHDVALAEEPTAGRWIDPLDPPVALSTAARKAIASAQPQQAVPHRSDQ